MSLNVPNVVFTSLRLKIILRFYFLHTDDFLEGRSALGIHADVGGNQLPGSLWIMLFQRLVFLPGDHGHVVQLAGFLLGILPFDGLPECPCAGSRVPHGFIRKQLVLCLLYTSLSNFFRMAAFLASWAFLTSAWRTAIPFATKIIYRFALLNMNC